MRVPAREVAEALAAANSSGIQPAPMPTLSRPPDKWSWVASSAARTPGERYGVSMMLIPIRNFVVFAASQGISVMPWNHSPRETTGIPFGNSVIIPNGYCSSHAVGGLGDHDPVERPDGVEVELLGQRREVLEFLDRHLVAEVGKVERELHSSGLLGRRSLTCFQIIALAGTATEGPRTPVRLVHSGHAAPRTGGLEWIPDSPVAVIDRPGDKVRRWT